MMLMLIMMMTAIHASSVQVAPDNSPLQVDFDQLADYVVSLVGSTLKS